MIEEIENISHLTELEEFWASHLPALSAFTDIIGKREPDSDAEGAGHSASPAKEARDSISGGQSVPNK